MRSKITLFFVGCLVALGVANFFSHKGIRHQRANLSHSFTSPQSHLPSDVIRFLAGEFKGLVADYLLMEVGSFLGSKQASTHRDWENLHLALKHALALDPYFQQTYLYAQGSLPWQGNMPRETIELLEISRQHRPWDTFPGQYIGFNYYFFLNDYAKASEVFLETAKIQGSQPIFAVLGARFAMKAQRSQAAIALLADMLNNQDIDPSSRHEIESRLIALKHVVLLEQSIARYRKQFNRYPASLDDLVAEQLIGEIPANPYGKHYLYNPEKGQVRFDDVQ